MEEGLVYPHGSAICNEDKWDSEVNGFLIRFKKQYAGLTRVNLKL